MSNKFDPDAYLKSKGNSDGFDPDEYLKGPTSSLESLGRGALQGASLGFADEITGAVESALSDKTYEQARDESRRNYENAKKDHEFLYGAGELGGGVATALIPGAGALNSIKGAAALGAATGLGNSTADLTKGDVAGAVKDAALGGVVGGVAHAAIPAIGSKIKEAGGWAGKKVGNAGFGVGEEATDWYLKDPTKARKVIAEGGDGLRAIKDKVDQAYSDKVTKVQEDAASGLIEAKDAKREAERLYKDYVAELKNIRPDDSLTDDVVSGVSKENAKLSKLSGEAYNTLDGLEFDRKPLLDKIQEIKGTLLVDGKRPTIGDTAPAWGVLDRLESAVKSKKTPDLDSIMNQAEEVPGIAGRDLKKLIQQLDQESQAAYTTYGSRGAARPIKNIRDELDPFLKSHQPYADAMVPTAQQAKLVSQLTDVFGDAGQARRALLKAADPEKGATIRKWLTELDKNNDTNIMDGLSEYMNAQKLLKDPEARLNSQRMMLNPTQRGLEDAQLKASDARGLSKQFGKLNPNQSESTIERVGRGNNFEGEDQIRDLIGEDGLESVKDYSLGHDFVTDKTRGARRAVTGAAVGMFGGPVGGLAGAAAGMGIDKYGGRIWQAILDGTIKAGPYAKLLEDAAKRGPAAVGAMHLFLMKNRPDYKKAVEESE